MVDDVTGGRVREAIWVRLVGDAWQESGSGRRAELLLKPDSRRRFDAMQMWPEVTPAVRAEAVATLGEGYVH